MSKLLPHLVVNPQSEHRCSIIWLHGLGDSGYGFEPIVDEINLPEALGAKFILPHAPQRPITVNGGMEMPAWYDIFEMDLGRKIDLPQIEQSKAQIDLLIDHEIQLGIPSSKIILAGFSQGGAVALHTGLQRNTPLGGILALSTYLPDSSILKHPDVIANTITPIFFGHGKNDPVVALSLAKAAFNQLEQHQFKLQWTEYPMAHSVCVQEIRDIQKWMLPILK